MDEAPQVHPHRLGTLCRMDTIWPRCGFNLNLVASTHKPRVDSRHTVYFGAGDICKRSIRISVPEVAGAASTLGDLGALVTIALRESAATAVCTNGNANRKLLLRR